MAQMTHLVARPHPQLRCSKNGAEAHTVADLAVRTPLDGSDPDSDFASMLHQRSATIPVFPDSLLRSIIARRTRWHPFIFASVRRVGVKLRPTLPS
jgi:hypothetical protein